MSSKPNLIYPDGDFSFLTDGGETNVDGKSYWPSLLRVHMDRWKAFIILQELAIQLAREDQKEFTLHFSGCFEKEDE